MPKISIVTTTYKHENFIRDTIESILSQSYTDWELLIGDDSPDDNSWKIIEEYTNKYSNKIRAWHHNPNRGIVGNMNFLIEQASKDSEYITFLEGDDLYTPDNLEEKMRVFEKYPEVAFVYSDLEYINEFGVTQKNSIYNGNYPFTQKVVSLDEYLSSSKSIFSYSSTAIHKKIFEDIKIRNLTNSPIFAVSDYDFFGRILLKFPFKIIPKVLVQYRWHSNNISMQSTYIADDLLALLEFYRENRCINLETFRICTMQTYISKSSAYLLQGKKFKSILPLLISFYLNPFSQFSRKLKNIIAIFLPTIIVRRLFFQALFDTK